jgi:hypothetical protein
MDPPKPMNEALASFIQYNLYDNIDIIQISNLSIS